jgi:hypothetical protein
LEAWFIGIGCPVNNPLPGLDKDDDERPLYHVCRLTGRSPAGTRYLAGIDEPTARLLQTVAWETVQDYYGK